MYPIYRNTFRDGDHGSVVLDTQYVIAFASSQEAARAYCRELNDRRSPTEIQERKRYTFGHKRTGIAHLPTPVGIVT